jgi:Tfp pilus assembly protein PilP
LKRTDFYKKGDEMKMNKALLVGMKKHLLLVIAVMAQDVSVQGIEWRRPQLTVGQLKNAIQYEQNELNDPNCQQWAKDEINQNLASLKIQLQIAELQSSSQSKVVSKRVHDLRKQLQIMQLKNEIQYEQNELNDPNCQQWAKNEINPNLAGLKRQLQNVQRTP